MSFTKTIRENIKTISMVCTLIGALAGAIKAYHDIISHMETQGHSAKVEKRVVKLNNKLDTITNKLDALTNKVDKNFSCPNK